MFFFLNNTLKTKINETGPEKVRINREVDGKTVISTYTKCM